MILGSFYTSKVAFRASPSYLCPPLCESPEGSQLFLGSQPFLGCSCEFVDFESWTEILVSVCSLFIFMSWPLLEPEGLVRTASNLLSFFTLQLQPRRKVTVSPQSSSGNISFTVLSSFVWPLCWLISLPFFFCLVSLNSVPSLSLSISVHLHAPLCLTCFYASFVAWLRRGILIVWDLLHV